MTMKKLLVSVLLLLSLFTGGEANARTHHIHIHHQHISRSFGDGRPNAWCGWQMRQFNPGHERPGLNLNMARDWAKVGTGTVPGINVIAVWPHHVAQIDGYDAKRHMWTVRQGNPYREHHPRSLAGAIAFRQL